MKFGVSLLSSLLFLAACGPSGQESTGGETIAKASVPVSVIWKWTGVEGADPASVAQSSRYTLEFMEDGRYAVRADCNSGAGSWSLEVDTLSLNAGPMTLAMCGRESLDQRFLQLLGGVSGFEMQEDRLMLSLGDATKMMFVAMPRIQLAGTSWLVRATNNGTGAVTTILADTELTMEFSTEGQVTGSAGCNRFNGSFETVAQTLSFSPLATTRRTCMNSKAVEQEQYFLAALSTVATWEIRAERAQLRAVDGALAVDLISAVTGTAMIRTKQALPPGAVLTVQLQDVSRADAPAIIVGELVQPLEGRNSPFPFAVVFDPAEIDERMSYTVRATVHSDSQLLFTTTQAYPVLTRDSDQFGLDVRLDAVGQ